MMFELAVEIIRSLVLMGIVALLWRAGRKEPLLCREGWFLITGGFGLLLFGSLLDVSNEFEGLGRFVVIGDTEIEAFLEKTVGLLGGLVVLALGLMRWIPGVRRFSQETALRGKTEAALRESERRLAKAQQLARIGYWSWSLGDEGMHYVSSEYAAILGLAPDQVPRKQAEFNRFIHPADRARVEACFHEVTRNLQDYEIDYRIVRPDGELRHVVETGELLYDEADRPTGHTGTIQDITTIKAARQALHVSEARLSGILDIAAEAIISVGADQRIRLFNQSAEMLFGYSAEEIMGQPLERLLPPSVREVHRQHLEAFARSSETSRMMDKRGYVIGLRKDGSEFPAGASISKFEIDGEQVFTVTVHDFAERNRTDMAMRESEARAKAAEQHLLDAIESISDGFVLYDSEDRLVLCNTKWKDLYGYSDSQIVPGISYEELVRLDVELGAVVDEASDYLSRRIDYRRRFQGAFDVHLADGRWITIRERKTSDGGIVGIQSEITERKRAEDKIRESEQQFRSVVDNSPSAIFLKDTAGCYRLVNRRFEEWYGLSAQDTLGRTSHEIFPKDHADAYVAQDRDALETGKVITREHEIPFADGSIHLIIVTKFPVRDSDGRSVGVGTINTDVTDLKQNESALLAAKVEAELANRAKSEFLANMSHELRTPLNAIIGFSELIENETLGPVGTAQYRDHAMDIAESGRHLLRLINDILDLSKIEAGKVDLYEEDIDMTEAIRSSLVLVGGRAHHEGITLERDTPEGLPRLHADERMLKQILLNLLSNAVKFTPAGGRVEARAWADPEVGYVLQISDTGIGMKLEDIPKAMVRFGQIDGRLNRKFEGTGLGLPLTKSFVDLHGGTLDLDSEPGVGTTVTVRFPAERIVGLPKAERPSERIRKAAG
jgi:PAS domain S-box-containing protein